MTTNTARTAYIVSRKNAGTPHETVPAAQIKFCCVDKVGDFEHFWLRLLQSLFAEHMDRDQLNSRFHGRDIFREIGLLP